MKKFIVLLIVCCLSNLSFSQDLQRLKHSDLSNIQFIQTNNLEDFSRLATSAEVGVAYFEQNQIKSFNIENGIKLIRTNSEDIQFLNSNHSFEDSVEMIVINVSNSEFNIQSIDCSIIEQFRNLKYLYFVYQININENTKLPSLNCISNNVKQFYSSERPI